MSALSGSSQLLAVHKKSVVEQGVSTNLHSTTRRLKRSMNFESVEDVQSSNSKLFEVRTLSNSNSNFITSPVAAAAAAAADDDDDDDNDASLYESSLPSSCCAA